VLVGYAVAMYYDDNIFAKILRGELPPGAGLIYEDADTLAFLDINPNTPGHTLVIPKAQSRNVFDIEEASWLAVMKTVRTLAPVIREALGAEGVFLSMNNEIGQLVFHSHVHIIPRYANDGLEPWKGKPYEEGEGALVAGKIRGKLAGL
jgi:diadenosine tetraphosphate (Ap4A) HIT family hydrolase